MALLSKKPKADSASVKTLAPAAKAGKRGRKKGKDAPAPAAGADANGFDDFADLSEGAITTSTGGAKSERGKKRGIKNGTFIGLNIGNDSIKAIELRAKGGEIAITAMSSVPTPGESISNGVVMSVGSLAHALRDLFKQGKFKSRRVVTSVAGTGALVVRVLEVPRMSDQELASNMAADADRYIPFPPSEVLMDHKALRDLPSDPDAANMEVLLAAAQREIVDLHIKVLTQAKLDPHAIDVEPLAAARALTYAAQQDAVALNGPGAEDIDYNDVSAILNIGATGTEISVLRGDILVFTRSIGLGGHTLTQAIVEYLGLPWHDAERLKRDVGDALPPQAAPGAAAGASWEFGGAPAAGAAPAAAGDDAWDDFSAFDMDDVTAGLPDVTAGMAPASTPGGVAGGAPADAGGTKATAPLTDDQFDQEFFNQGPRQDEPQQQHGQAEKSDGGASPFDFNFSEDATAPAAGNEAQPAAAPAFDFSFPELGGAPAPGAPAAQPAQAAEPAAPVFDFNQDTAAEPAPAAAAPAAPAPASNDFDLSFDALATPAPEAPAAAAPGAAATSPAPAPVAAAPEPAPAFSLDEPAAPESFAPAPDFDISDTSPAFTLDDAAEPAAIPDVVVGSPSAYDLTTFEMPDETTAPAPAAAVPVAPATGGGLDDDFDIDSLFAAGPPLGDSVPSTITGGVTPTAPAAGFDAPAADFGGPVSDFGDFNEDFADFGAGLTSQQPLGIEAETVHTILRPYLEDLTNEVRRSLEYHASRYPDAVVRRIYALGGGARLKNIDAYLTQALGIPTTIGNPANRMSIQGAGLDPKFVEENGPIFAVAIGLALRDMV